MIHLEFQNVSFTYAGSQTAALQDISFQIQEGEFILLCGASACGKTTLLRHVIKTQIPIGNGSGKLLYRGENIETMDDVRAVRQIGYVGQQPENQIVTDTVWHELAFGLESLGKPVEEIRRRTAEMAEYFGLSHLFRKKTAELSGGQKQLLNLASAMILQPSLLVLDEPTSQLDPIACGHFLDALSKLHRDFGITVLLSEQRLEQTLSMADRVMVMEQGKLLVTARAEECIEQIRGRAQAIYPALPAATRVYLETGGSGSLPLTVGEGRQYLQKQKTVEHHGLLSGEEDTGSQFDEKKISGEKGTDSQSGNKKISSEGSISRSLDNRKNKGAESLIWLKNVSFRYPENGTDVLRNLSFDLPQGSIYGILGGNGSGKTTALKIMAGIYRPDAGTCTTDAHVLYLPQNPKAVFNEISVEDELAEMLLRKGEGREKIISEVEQMLSMMGLAECRKQHPYDLSGGQMQRLALAKALLLKPEVLLLDEPTKGLDAAFKQQLGSYLQQIREKGITILLVSHDIEFCAEYMTHCGLLFDGEMIWWGEKREFFRNNYFYNTAAARMAEGTLRDILTAEDITQCLQRNEVKSEK